MIMMMMLMMICGDVHIHSHCGVHKRRFVRSFARFYSHNLLFFLVLWIHSFDSVQIYCLLFFSEFNYYPFLMPAKKRKLIKLK